MPHETPMEPLWLTVDEAAALLRMNPHTLYRGIRRKEVPYILVGNMYKIPGSFLLLQPPSTTPHYYQDTLDLVWDTYKPTKRKWRNLRPDLSPPDSYTG